MTGTPYEPSERELEALAQLKAAQAQLEKVRADMTKDLENRVTELRRNMAAFEAKYGYSLLDVLPGQDPDSVAGWRQIANELALYDAIGARAMVELKGMEWLVEDGVDENDVQP